MTLEESRLDLAVRIAARAMRSTPDAAVGVRLDAFRQAYTTLSGLDATGETEAWAIQALDAAWSLAEEAFPRGGALPDVLAAVQTAHGTVLAARRIRRVGRRAA